MSFDEIKAAALALPDEQRIELLQAIDTTLPFTLSPEDEADLRDAIAEHEADPEGGEDAFVVLERVRRELHERRAQHVVSP